MRNDRLRSYNNIFIIGMPACGKSTFGRAYAYFSNRNFLDFDVFLEKSLKTTIPKIFASQGLQGFRAQESKVLQLLAHKTNCVIALGGGTLLSPHNHQLAHEHGIIVSLTGLPINELATRISNDKINSKMRVRPLFAQCDNIEQVKEKLNELYQERSTIYEKADIILNQDFTSHDNMMLTLKQAEQNFDSQGL